MINKKTYAPFFILVLCSILIGGIGIQGAIAQEDESDDPQLGTVTTFDVEINKLPRFIEVNKKMKKAGVEANLGPEFAFAMYTSNWDYLSFSPISSMAELDDEHRAGRAITGTPGEEIMESMSLEGVGANWKSEVVQFMPEWSYLPEEAPLVANYVEIQEHWLLPASRMGEKYHTVVTEIIDFFKKIDYPIKVEAYRYRIGEKRYAFVFNYNDRSAYQSEYSPTVLLQKHPEFQDIINRLTTHLVDFKKREWNLVPELSYLPNQSEEE